MFSWQKTGKGRQNLLALKRRFCLPICGLCVARDGQDFALQLFNDIEKILILFDFCPVADDCAV